MLIKECSIFQVSFDINKDGRMVAQLTLVKSAYRLGEIVEGLLEFNLAPDSGRVIKVAVTLETSESIETSHLAEPARSGDEVRTATSKVHSDQEEFLLNHNRGKFALVIPTDGTPEFACSAVRLQWTIRVRFLFLPASTTPVPPASTRHQRIGSTSAAALMNLSKQHSRSRSFAYGFQPTVAVPPNPSPTTGATHLLPADAAAGIFRPIPDLSYVPIVYGQSAEDIVLIPAKLETVECSIPIKVFPSNTAFRPIVSQFLA